MAPALPLTTPRLARAFGQAVVATALLGSLMGYATVTGNSDKVEWPVGGSHDTAPKPRVGL